MPEITAEKRTTLLNQLAGLKRMAERPTTNVNEASTAVALMAKIMQRHNITDHDINKHLADSGDTEKCVDRMFHMPRANTPVKWRLLLAATVGINLGCLAFRCYDKGNGRGQKISNWYRFFGTPANTEMAEWLSVYAIREVARLADEGWNKLDRRMGESAWKTAFYLGATHAIDERLRTQQEQTIQAMERGDLSDLTTAEIATLNEVGISAEDLANAPVPQARALVVNQKAVVAAKYEEQTGVKLGKGRPININIAEDKHDAWRKGYRAAQEIPLNKPIAGATTS